MCLYFVGVNADSQLMKNSAQHLEKAFSMIHDQEKMKHRDITKYPLQMDFLIETFTSRDMSN